MSAVKPKTRNGKSDLKTFLVKTAAVLLVFASASILLSSCSQNIPLTNVTGDVSVKYVSSVPRGIAQEALLPHYTEDELFDKADCIFSGKISEIRHIQISWDGSKLYKSLIKIKVDTVYKGDIEKKTVTMFTPCCNKWISESSTNDLLYTIERGDYGVFFTVAAPKGTEYRIGDLAFDLSEICDVRITDGMRFAILKDGKTGIRTSFSSYPSLKDKTWDDAIAFVKDKTN